MVSAGAGAGKTAVLVERILEAALDREDPLHLDRLLVVTFTDAAAREMRQRLEEALTQLEQAHPADPLVREQIQRLERTWMSTLHGFCQRVVRRWGLAAGVAPDTRLLDEGEARLRLSRDLEHVVGEALASEDADIVACLEGSAPDGDRALLEALSQGVRRLLSLPDPHAWIEKALEAHGDGKEGQHALDCWIATLAEDLATRLQSATAAWHQWATDLAATGAFHSQAEHGQGIAEALADAAARLRSHALPAPETLVEVAAALRPGASPRIAKGDDKEAWADWAAQRKRLQDQLTTLRSHPLASPGAADGALSAHLAAAPQVRGYLKLLHRLLRTHAVRKREAGVMDFGDLEHLALSLMDPGRPGGTEILAALRSRFDEVLVDEVQDTNPIQEALLRRLLDAGEDGPRAFFVGDVKQAIYGFRMADPALFLARLNQAETSAEARARRIDLPHNFRSRATLLEALNGVFSHLFDCSTGGLDYDDREALQPGADYPEVENPVACWVTVPNPEELDRTEAQARGVAALVGRLLSPEGAEVWDKGASRRAHAGDIAVLVRDGSSIGPIREALEESGVPSVGNLRAGWFDTPEVSFLRDVLHVLDNPRQDRPLLRVARSRLGSMSDQDLADLRQLRPTGPFHACILDPMPAGSPAADRAGSMLAWLAPWRKLARRLAAAELVERLLESPEVLQALAHEGPTASAPANLEVLLQRARLVAMGGSRGLGAFLANLQELEDEQTRIDRPALAGESAHAVQVMTIHASKGLQFPVVLVPGLDRNFPTRDHAAPCQIHRGAGIGMKARDPLDGSTRETPARLAVARENRRDALAEEIRVLYVAMTRAREQLYLISGPPRGTLLAQATAIARAGVRRLTLEHALSCTSWLGMLTPFFLRHPGAAVLHHHWDLEPETSRHLLAMPSCQLGPWRFQHETVEAARPAHPDSSDAEPVEKPQPPHADPYPWEEATRTPAKRKVTELGRPEETPKPRKPEPFRPRFMLGADREPGPAELGQALHMVLQHLAPTTPATTEAARTVIADLLQRGMLAPAPARRLNPEAIAWWLDTPLMARLRGGDSHLHREVPFALAADRLGLPCPPGEAPLIQGIIDAVLEESDHLEVWDYKTDAPDRKPLGDLIAEHRLQVEVYATAAELLFGKPVRARHLVFLSHRQIVTLDPA